MEPTAARNLTDAPHILLVDDNSYGLVARKAVLQELGYRVQTAQTGEEALELFGREKFALVVTDYKMPRMSGVDLIRKIRSAEPRTRIILLSGFVDALGLSEQSTGADIVIAKCAGEVQALLRSVGRLLEKRALRKPVRSHKPLPRASSARHG